MLITQLLILVPATALLIAGAELLVRGASRIAASTGVSTLIIGLTVVAFGTSSPELAVTLQAILSGKGGIALGNIVGSNLINTLAILGISAMIIPLVIHHQVIRIELPVVIGASALMYLFAWDGRIHNLEGLALVLLLAIYIGWQCINGRRQTEKATATTQPSNWIASLLCLITGMAMLGFGAHWLVESASTIARLIGISETIIGLTIVAIGTSLPELATSIVAAVKGDQDMAVGNVMGSNIFNILSVLGIGALVAPHSIVVEAQLLAVDMPLLLLVSLLALPLFLSGYSMQRWEGGMFAGIYGLYTAWLLLTATSNPAADWLMTVSSYGLMPIIVMAVGWTVVKDLARKQRVSR